MKATFLWSIPIPPACMSAFDYLIANADIKTYEQLDKLLLKVSAMM